MIFDFAFCFSRDLWKKISHVFTLVVDSLNLSNLSLSVSTHTPRCHPHDKHGECERSICPVVRGPFFLPPSAPLVGRTGPTHMSIGVQPTNTTTRPPGFHARARPLLLIPPAPSILKQDGNPSPGTWSSVPWPIPLDSSTKRVRMSLGRWATDALSALVHVVQKTQVRRFAAQSCRCRESARSPLHPQRLWCVSVFVGKDHRENWASTPHHAMLVPHRFSRECRVLIHRSQRKSQ